MSMAHRIHQERETRGSLQQQDRQIVGQSDGPDFAPKETFRILKAFVVLDLTFRDIANHQVGRSFPPPGQRVEGDLRNPTCSVSAKLAA